MQVTLDVKTIDTDQLVKIGKACADEVSKRASVQHSFSQSLFAGNTSTTAWKNPQELKAVRAHPIIKKKKEKSGPVMETDVYNHRYVKVCKGKDCTCRYYLKEDDEELKTTSEIDKNQLHVRGFDASVDWEENRTILQTVIQANTCNLFTGKGQFITADQKFPYDAVNGDDNIYRAVYDTILNKERSFDWEGQVLHIALQSCMRVKKLKIIPNTSFGFITFESHADAACAQVFFDHEGFSCNFVNKTVAAAAAKKEK